MSLTASIPRTVLVPEVVWEHYDPIAKAVKHAVRRWRRPELEDDVLNDVLARALRNPLDSRKGSVKAWVRNLVDRSLFDVVGRRASSRLERCNGLIPDGVACVDGEARAIAHIQIGEFARQFPWLSRREQEEVRRDVGALPKVMRPRRKRKARAGRQGWLSLLLVAIIVLYVLFSKRAH